MKIGVYDAVLKGCVERGDGGAYLGSTTHLGVFLRALREAGWINSEEIATDAGIAQYGRRNLGRLPKSGRWYLWKEAR